MSPKSHRYQNSFINRNHLHEIEDGYYGELQGLGRRPILNAYSMDLGAGNYSSALDQARTDANNAMTAQAGVLLGGALAAPVMFSASVGGVSWLASTGRTAGHLAQAGTKAPATWNQFQSSLWGAGLSSTERAALWSTYKSVGGQATGLVLRPAVGSAYVGASEIIASGGNVISKVSIMSGGLGLASGYYGITPTPELPSGNPILFPYEIGQFFGTLVGNFEHISSATMKDAP